MTVIDLDSRRHEFAETDADMALCPCGSGWFALRGRTTDPEVAATGAVTMDVSGMITGYIGEPVCVECGEPWAPTIRGAVY